MDASRIKKSLDRVSQKIDENDAQNKKLKRYLQKSDLKLRNPEYDRIMYNNGNQKINPHMFTSAINQIKNHGSIQSLFLGELFEKYSEYGDPLSNKIYLNFLSNDLSFKLSEEANEVMIKLMTRTMKKQDYEKYLDLFS